MIKIVTIPEFTLEIFLETVDNAIELNTGKHLTPMEKYIAREGYWKKITYKKIYEPAKHLCHKQDKTNGYSYDYFANHIGHNLTNEISEAINDTVGKFTVVEPLRRQHEKNLQAKFIADLTKGVINYLIIIKRPLIERFIYFLTDATRNNQCITFRDNQIEFIREARSGKTYEEIACSMKRGSCRDEQCKSNNVCDCTYPTDTIRKDVASKTYKVLKDIFNKKVTKINFQYIVNQWQKNQEIFIWKLIQIATLQTKGLTFVEDCPAKTQRSNSRALITLLLLVLVNNACDASANESIAGTG